MAGVNFKDESPMSINLSKEETIKAQVTDINYIPSYKIAELERQANEEERIAYYNDIQQKVANGEFNGKDGEKGEKGDKGEDGTLIFEELTEEQKASLKGDKGDKGEDGKDGVNGKDGVDGKTPVLGVDYWTESDKTEVKNYCNSYIDSQLGTINEQLASLTEVE